MRKIIWAEDEGVDLDREWIKVCHDRDGGETAD
jgi:hypothetical protein